MPVLQGDNFYVLIGQKNAFSDPKEPSLQIDLINILKGPAARLIRYLKGNSRMLPDSITCAHTVLRPVSFMGERFKSRPTGFNINAAKQT